ncbi:MAG: type II secretion system protein [Sedimentisphaerales bacterium]|nr:type II secretion system protein [Sedimentisphaerales bacterium]
MDTFLSVAGWAFGLCRGDGMGDDGLGVDKMSCCDYGTVAGSPPSTRLRRPERVPSCVCHPAPSNYPHCHPERSNAESRDLASDVARFPFAARSLDRARDDKVNHQSSIIHPHAFTLIELLVVIAVIALLMAILIPALQRARRQARTVVCQSNLRQWAMTLGAYTQTYEGRFPSLSGRGPLWLLRGTFIGAMDPDADHAALHGFHTRGIALCPMASRPLPLDPNGGGGSFTTTSTTTSRGSRVSWHITGRNGTSTNAWEILAPEPRFLGSYGYNGTLFTGFRIEAPLPIPYLNTFTLREHASIPVLLDATQPVGYINRAYSIGARGREGGRILGLSPGLNEFVMDRHGRATNGMFLDWSVRSVGLKELYTLKWASDFDRANRWTKAGGVQPDDWPKWMRECKDY